jgi:hypothetical protein
MDRKRTRPRQKGWGKWLYVLPLAALLIGIGGGWLLARQRGVGLTAPKIRLAPISQLSEEIAKAPRAEQEAYRFAIANPEILSKLPCYCGCGGIGHKSSLDCFIKRFDPDGSIVFDDHALK